eukprot:TRINITY_DN18029_c0_g1_i1.p1 TRINITY_DN18029_c0_g1~~TRINITY_DN18029_c0_g1_i1.p1  ORF type:complete len:159 (+),score=25.47 TRINITY_DN18029_c0_g1_i1:164-640(+)
MCIRDRLSTPEQATFPLLRPGDYAPPVDTVGIPSLHWASPTFSGRVPHVVGVDIIMQDDVSGSVVFEASKVCALVANPAGRGLGWGAEYGLDGCSQQCYQLDLHTQGVHLECLLGLPAQETSRGCEGETNVLGVQVSIEASSLERWFGVVPPHLSKDY